MEHSPCGFVGTYTDNEADGVFSYRIDSKTGEMHRTSATTAGSNPSFVALGPKRDRLYVVNEIDAGAAIA